MITVHKWYPAVIMHISLLGTVVSALGKVNALPSEVTRPNYDYYFINLVHKDVCMYLMKSTWSALCCMKSVFPISSTMK